VLRRFLPSATRLAAALFLLPMLLSLFLFSAVPGAEASAVVPSSSGFAATGETTNAQLARSGRWVDVNLSTLTARAMQGSQVVFSVPVNTGKPGWTTPVGSFPIMRKVASTTMRSQPSWSEQYVQPDVPWVMYFTKYGHAIHGNYWVPASWFGTRNTSHGCVGMSVASAKMFYDFTSVGTVISIHR
jgi:lipoprotein-anchoring transpeptidase ErfK/SrfK